MEDDLELFNDNGLDGFGLLLGAALKLPVVAPQENSLDGSSYPLHLTYR